MNYQGEQLIHIYAADSQSPNRLDRPSTKRLWLYRQTDGFRPRTLAKFGERYYPVHRRAGRLYIIVGELAEPRPQQPATQRPATVEAAVDEMLAQGKASKPALASRLDSAAALVLGGKVALDGDEAKVSVYRVTTDCCECADFQHRGGWCKHRLAVRMARHLAASGFAVPTEATAPRPMAANGTGRQISAENLALIASGRVVDNEQRSRLAYHNSEHGAHTAALRMLGNGARSLPADLARRAGIGTNREVNDGR